MESEHGATAHHQDAILNGPQRRRFQVFLELLQKSLDEVEALASPGPSASPGSLLVYEMDIPAHFRDRSGPIIRRLRNETDELARSLDIRPTRRSRLNRIRAILTAEIVRVDDTLSKRLGGYGSVNPRVKLEIDPKLSVIRSELQALLAQLGSSPK